MTNAPMLFSVGCIGIFIITALAFVCWDMNVKTRQKKLAMRVQKTNKIVSAMFPKSIQAQLLKNSGDLEALTRKTAKKVDYSNLMEEKSTPAEGNAFGTKPVADLYVATTIMVSHNMRMSRSLCPFQLTSSHSVLHKIVCRYSRIHRLV